MVKAKGVIPRESPLYENPKARFKHQSLLQDYEELRTETEDLKRKLLMMKQKKSMLLAEVRFLRRRHQYLTKNSSLDRHSNLVLVQPQRLDDQRASKKRKDLPTLADSNQKQRIYSGSKASPNVKRAAFQNPATTCNLSQKERICGGKEADNRSGTPFLDLNQISREEEDLQSGFEPLKAIQESSRSILRVESTGRKDGGKMFSCRKIESGSNGPRKRKISWQDQVALRA